MVLLSLFRCLTDETCLKSVLLIFAKGELCVCELTEALDISQPKVSRHLAQLRSCGLPSTRREGQWIYYVINTALPEWTSTVTTATAENNQPLNSHCCARLGAMRDRPRRNSSLCGNAV